MLKLKIIIAGQHNFQKLRIKINYKYVCFCNKFNNLMIIKILIIRNFFNFN